jgi:4-diphosphocytidyl-2-C-methyl-D-erythritol kinase
VSTGDASATRGARAVEVAAQAKINLRLRILARETTGYHQLETLFLRIDLADTLRIRRTSGDRSLDVVGDVDRALIGPVEKNLAWRAAEAYFAAKEMRGGFAIELEKRIPIGGGLGGGSADAGAVLRALDAMDDEAMEPGVLFGLASELGADVPFLTAEYPYALGWGRGERMLALTPPPSRDVLLVVPAFSVNTAEAFGWLAALPRRSPRRFGESFVLTPEQLSDWTTLETFSGNHFEPVVWDHHPEMDECHMYLRLQGCSICMMSGSGSTLFGIWTAPSSGSRRESPSIELPHGAKVMHTRTSSRVEQVSAIE